MDSASKTWCVSVACESGNLINLKDGGGNGQYLLPLPRDARIRRCFFLLMSFCAPSLEYRRIRSVH